MQVSLEGYQGSLVISLMSFPSGMFLQSRGVPSSSASPEPKPRKSLIFFLVPMRLFELFEYTFEE